MTITSFWSLTLYIFENNLNYILKNTHLKSIEYYFIISFSQDFFRICQKFPISLIVNLSEIIGLLNSSTKKD